MKIFVLFKDTSRTKRQGEVEGREYNFVKREDMQKAIEHGDYMEWGEFNGNFYGTSVESVREIVRSGKMCVLDASPNVNFSIFKIDFHFDFNPNFRRSSICTITNLCRILSILVHRLLRN